MPAIPLSRMRAAKSSRDDHKPIYSICVSGAAASECLVTAKESAVKVGRAIAEDGHVAITTTTPGVPYIAAQGAKERQGVSIGFSPAISRKEHINAYHLPDDAFDMVVYTGSDSSGRNLLMVRSSDAIIFICGRIGALHEFSEVLEENKVIGVLTGPGSATSEIAHIVRIAKGGSAGIIYDSDPVKLVGKVVAAIQARQALTGRPLEIRERGRLNG